MHSLVTPITPAAVIGHCDASPRSTEIIGCGQSPQDICDALNAAGVKIYFNTGPCRRCEALRNAASLIANAERADVNETGYGHWVRTGLVHHDHKPNPAAEALQEKYLNLLLMAEKNLAEEMKSKGVAISVSAYNADSNTAVAYVDGKPICTLY